MAGHLSVSSIASNTPDANGNESPWRSFKRFTPWFALMILTLLICTANHWQSQRLEDRLRLLRQLEQATVGMHLAASDVRFFSGQIRTSRDTSIASTDLGSTEAMKLALSTLKGHLNTALSVNEQRADLAIDPPSIAILQNTHTELQRTVDALLQTLQNSPGNADKQQAQLFLVLSRWQIQTEAIAARLRYLTEQILGERKSIQNSNFITFVFLVISGILLSLDVMHTLRRTSDLHAKREANLAQLSQQDPLTGLLNRRGWESYAQKAMDRCRHGRMPMVVGMLDIDHFKRYNDQYGHAQGDVLLIEFSNLIFKRCRPGDIMARMGGEEFAVGFPNCSEAVAEKLVARFREGLGQSATFSAGLATVQEYEGIEQALDRADKALYLAKERGRNTTVIAPLNMTDASRDERRLQLV